MNSHRYNVGGLRGRLNQLARSSAAEKVRLITCCDSERGEGIAELAAADGTIKLDRGDWIPRTDVEPADMLVFASGDQDVHLLRPEHAFDCSFVGPGANFEACSCRSL